jgi:integrase/recombinase XerC
MNASSATIGFERPYRAERFASSVATALEELPRLTDGLSKAWTSFLTDWDRTLRSGNYPKTTRYNYLLAASQLAHHLVANMLSLDADAAAEDPTEVRKDHAESFQAWMIETRSAATALNKHKGLQQFFKWLMVDAEEIDSSPMAKVRQPKVDKKLTPII